MTVRHRVLPSSGRLLLSTLHGNAEDLEALRAVFEALGPDGHWVLLGDLVHGPDARSRRDDPALYGYEDRSGAMATEVLRLRRQHPERVHYVLGNHDHGHVGGPHTRKFYGDEVLALESRLDEGSLAALRTLFAEALLVVAAPCGLLMTHGAPDASLTTLDLFDGMSLDLQGATDAQRRALVSVLRSYGQTEARCQELLAGLRDRSGLDLRVVVHGHDRDESGWFVEGTAQVCPVVFGAPRGEKRYVLADLGARYACAADLRDGHELRRLYS